MKYELNEKELKMFKKISDITDVDYEIKNNMISIDTLVYALKDLLYEYGKIEEERDDLENDIRDNYEPKHFDPYDYYGVSRHDFY
jgi:hypothetical protein